MTEIQKIYECEVLAVGAGPVGLALAGDLGWRGHQCLLIDNGDGSIFQPKMDMVGIRTMEFCRRWGIVKDVEASPYNRAYPQDNVYLTSLTGYELGRQPMPSMGTDVPPPESPQKRERCPQNMFDPILRNFAGSQPGVDLRYRHELKSFIQDAKGVTATVVDLDTDETFSVRARYLVGCDGGRSTVREGLGIAMHGKGVLTNTTNVIFRCDDFNELHDKSPGYRYMFVGPEGTYGTIVAINGSNHWRMSIIGSAKERIRFDDAQIREFAYRMMGKPFDLEILSVLRWTRAELVAERYHEGRVFIAGDACHLTSPTGGLGMNTGIGDAVDLSWKISAALEGWGGPALFDSYLVERKPVAERITRFSTGNLQVMKQVPTSAHIYEDSEEGARVREEAGRALGEGLKREWFSQNMHLGNRYIDSPICVYTETESREALAAEYEDAVHYRPTSRPGCRAPHVWLADGRSTLDLFGRSFVLLDLSNGKGTAPRELIEVAAKSKVPFDVVRIDEVGVQSAYEKRYVLVRPDGHVAWRGDDLPANASELLETVTGNRAMLRVEEVDFDSAADLPALYDMLERVEMKNGWAKPTPSLYPEPKHTFVAAHWRYRDARAALHVAGRLVDTEKAERRNLIMANPIPGNDYPTVRTLVGAYQMVKAGETARSHRHTPNAMRVVIEAAPETYTIVDGIRVPMEPGDVLLTPNWCYHGHSNNSDAEAYWADFLDAPLVQLLNPMFFEVHPDVLEHVRGTEPASPMRFAFSEYKPRLLAQPEIAPGVRLLELGPPTLPTFDRVAVSLAQGATWVVARATPNAIFMVIEGAGTSWVDGRQFTWERGDMIAIPGWLDHRHTAASDAVLMRMSDQPLLEKLDWVRTGTAVSGGR